MELDAQQRFQIFCSVLQGVTADMAHMVTPEKVIEKAVEITEEAIAAATSGVLDQALGKNS